MNKQKFIGTIEDFIKGLQSEDLQNRIDSAWALSEMGDDAKPAMPQMLQALDDPTPSVVMYICDALRETKPESLAAIQKLKFLTENSMNKAIRAEAKITLLCLEDPDGYRKYQKRQRRNGILCCAFIVFTFIACLTGIFILVKWLI
jgi:HEAT repeat protein